MPQPPLESKNVKVEQPLPHETEMQRKQRLLAKVRVARDSLLRSQAEITGKNPAKAYSWVNVHESRVTAFEAMGYSICRDPNVKSAWRREDGSHRRGDMVLMECSAETKEAWDLLAESSSLEALEASQEGFKEFAGRSGVPVYTPPSGG